MQANTFCKQMLVDPSTWPAKWMTHTTLIPVRRGQIDDTYNIDPYKTRPNR